MSSQAKILRVACAANHLPTSGSVLQMLQRLSKAGKPKERCSGQSCQKIVVKKNTKPKAPKRKVAPPKKSRPTSASAQATGKSGKRLSASFYFHTLCKGKISLCKPQMILQPDNTYKLKEIRIVNGVHGRCPKWVLAK